MDEGANARAELDIWKLIARHGRASDLHDADMFADCFTEDGGFDRLGTTFKGRAAIRETLGGPGSFIGHHFTWLPDVRFTSDDTAVCTTYAQYIQWDKENGEVSQPFFVDYHDECRRTSEGWRFTKRCVKESSRG